MNAQMILAANQERQARDPFLEVLLFLNDKSNRIEIKNFRSQGLHENRDQSLFLEMPFVFPWLIPFCKIHLTCNLIHETYGQAKLD